jgi:menaquinone-dependent protoporphyrinogen oxidase
MKILAVYGSRFGQAEAILRRITGVLQTRGHEVSVFKGDQLPAATAVDSFDAIVVAASIIVGRYQPYIREFVARHLATLRDRPSAFVSVSGTSPESVPAWRASAERYVRQFLDETGWRPCRTATFAGALRYRRYGLVTRWIMKAISRRYGGPTDASKDYEFTDWQAVDRFAADLAEALAGRAG